MATPRQPWDGATLRLGKQAANPPSGASRVTRAAIGCVMRAGRGLRPQRQTARERARARLTAGSRAASSRQQAAASRPQAAASTCRRRVRAAQPEPWPGTAAQCVRAARPPAVNRALARTHRADVSHRCGRPALIAASSYWCPSPSQSPIPALLTSSVVALPPPHAPTCPAPTMQLSTAPALLALSLAACACVRALPSQLVMQDPLHRDVAAAADLAATLHAKHPAYFPPERSTDSDGIVTEVTTLTEISAADMEAYRADAQRPPHAAEPGSGWVWQSCGLDADVVRVDRVEVSPDPPRSGQNLTVKAAGEVKADVDVRLPSTHPAPPPFPLHPHRGI